MHGQNSTGLTDHYQLLGVSFNASEDEIRRAYRRMAMQWHPDRNDDPAAEEMMKKINRAWEILGDPESKAEYDRGYFRLRSISAEAQLLRSRGATTQDDLDALLRTAITQDRLDALLRTAIQENRTLQEISMLIDKGANVHARDKNRQSDTFSRTPLHLAAEFNENPAVIELLINRGADLYASRSSNDSYFTPLDYAARYNENPEVFRLLRSQSASATRGATATSSSNHSCVLSMLWSFFRQ